ncbi:hypothetical protein [Mesorhizobium sp. KR9-304]|uniref:hypothetical protein n=1 Tax=Mesorhizobium sp. KR9-304 TaxID=3156614 RepID=UPI0032B4E072
MNGIAVTVAIGLAVVSWLVGSYAILRMVLDTVREQKPNAAIVKVLEFVPRTKTMHPSKANPFAKLFLFAFVSFGFCGLLLKYLTENQP